MVLPRPSRAPAKAPEPERACSIATRFAPRPSLELRATLAHQQRGRLRYRHEPKGVYRLLEVLKEDGVELATMRGPWSVGSILLRRRGRGSPTMPSVECGQTRLFAATPERAAELAGLLDWCEVEAITSCPELMRAGERPHEIRWRPDAGAGRSADPRQAPRPEPRRAQREAAASAVNATGFARNGRSE